MQKTLILVVHGIGEQSPGETIDALTGGAVQELGLPGPIEGRTEMIAEEVEGSPHLNLFPCTIRRTTLRADGRNNLADDQDILAAEVYWSDLSPAPKGPINTPLDLVRTVLGLGYLAMENVDHANGNVSRWSRRGVHAVVWIFYALIAPLNALMLLASLSLLIDRFIYDFGYGAGKIPGSLVMAALGATVAAGCYLWRRKWQTRNSSYMLRTFMRGLGGLGVGLCLGALLIGLLTWLSLGWHMTLPRFDRLYLAACNVPDLTTCWSRDYQDIAMLAWLATIVMGAIWLGALIILLLMFVAMTLQDLGLVRTILGFAIPIVIFTGIQYATVAEWRLLLGAFIAATLILAVSAVILWHNGDHRATMRLRRNLERLTNFLGQRELIYLSVCNAMLIMWMLISSALWALFAQTVQQLDGSDQNRSLLTQVYQDYSGLLTSSLAYVLFALAALVLFGAVPVAVRRLYSNQLGQEASNWLDIWCGRLILNPAINLLLFLLILWIAFGGAFQAVLTGMQLFGLAYQDPFTGAVFTAVTDKAGALAPWTMDSLVARFGDFHNRITGHTKFALAVAAGLGVLIYRGRDFLAAALGVARDISIYSARTQAAKPGPDNDSRYAQREQILRRFQLVHDHLARQMDYDQLVIIAHSLGTVIAAQSLAQNQMPDRPRYLLTMGSPLTHIYGQYFAKGFGLDPLTGRLARWINIYRCDDFVGTLVRAPGGMVENLRVAPNGHTGYWTDRNVWSALRAALVTRHVDRDSPADPLVA